MYGVGSKDCGTNKKDVGAGFWKISDVLRDSVLGGSGGHAFPTFPQSVFLNWYLYRGWLYSRCISKVPLFLVFWVLISKFAMLYGDT